MIDKRDLKIDKQQEKNTWKLKIELAKTRNWLKMSLVLFRDRVNAQKQINLEWILFEISNEILLN